ncbi:MAG: dihydrodipicolinate reductase [Synergistales bacterium]|nr:dihydrodipicolinate reductase [Synergistales bacterium]
MQDSHGTSVPTGQNVFTADGIRAVIVGLGAMGCGIARLLLERGVEIVAAADTDPAKEGRDLGEILELGEKTGVAVGTVEEAAGAAAEIALLATSSFVREVRPEILRLVASGKNVISIAEEMAYPQAADPETAAELDAAAGDRGVTILGTGINPGFVLDTLILALTGPCTKVDAVKARRVNDLSPFGATVMATQGVGVPPEAFRQGVGEGRITGHIGFRQSVRMVADALGWKLDEIAETREPIVSTVVRETPRIRVDPGMVAGCNHTARGIVAGRAVITLEHPQQVSPHLEGVETGDYIRIEGVPQAVDMVISPEIPGGVGTTAMAVNMIPHVLAAPPGLTSMLDLPLPRAWSGDSVPDLG